MLMALIKKSTAPKTGKLALVMSGGGSRAAYQVGFLRYLAKTYPKIKFPFIVGMSAGAINAAHLANFPGTPAEAVESLVQLWCNLSPEKIFRVDSLSLVKRATNWTYRLSAGGLAKPTKIRGLVDTSPLRDFLYENLENEDGKLTEIGKKLESGDLKSLAISTTSYSTGKTITWTQGCGLKDWKRPNQVSKKTHFTVEHILASASIPIFFPAVKIGEHWHGDGSIRLYSPLSPAIHLGAGKIMAISTRFLPPQSGETPPEIWEYPPPAQIAGILLNTIFFDMLDQDAARLEQTNALLKELPIYKRFRRRVIDFFVQRPSADLSHAAKQFELKLPFLFKMLTRGQGTKETKSQDWLSMIMFQSDYLRYLIEMGEKDAESRGEEIDKFLV